MTLIWEVNHNQNGHKQTTITTKIKRSPSSLGLAFESFLFFFLFFQTNGVAIPIQKPPFSLMQAGFKPQTLANLLRGFTITPQWYLHQNPFLSTSYKKIFLKNELAASQFLYSSIRSPFWDVHPSARNYINYTSIFISIKHFKSSIDAT